MALSDPRCCSDPDEMSGLPLLSIGLLLIWHRFLIKRVCNRWHKLITTFLCIDFEMVPILPVFLFGGFLFSFVTERISMFSGIICWRCIEAPYMIPGDPYCPGAAGSNLHPLLNVALTWKGWSDWKDWKAWNQS